MSSLFRIRALIKSIPFAAFERPDSLDHGEEKSGCQPKKKHSVQRLQGAPPNRPVVLVAAFVHVCSPAATRFHQQRSKLDNEHD